MSEHWSKVRAGMRERLACAFAGKTTYRTPVEGRSTAPHALTDQDVAASLAYARQGPDDIGPDIAYCIVTGSDWHRSRIVLRIADALHGSGGYMLRKTRRHVLSISDDAYRVVVHGDTRFTVPADCPVRTYRTMVAAAAGIMESLADESISRAERSLRERQAA